MSLVLLMLFALGQNSQGQENCYSTTPINRECPRFREEVDWMDFLARRNSVDYPIDLIFVGDSITHGWDTLGESVWDQYYGTRLAFNFGISGDQTGHVLWRLENAPMNRIKPKMAVVMIGTNNPSEPADTALGIKKVVTVLKEKYPEIKILLLEVFPRGQAADSDVRKRVQAINESLRKECSDMADVTMMNLDSVFVDENGQIPGTLMHDYLHPTTAGYELWAKAIEPEIEKVLGPIPADPPECHGQQRETGRFNAKNEIFKSGSKVDVLMIGDSITHYWEREGVPVWNELFKDVSAINLGTGWDRTEDVIWRLEHYDFSKVDPKAAFLLIGVNNSLTSTPVNIAKGNRKICQILHEKFPNMKIYVQNVIPWGEGDLNGQNEVRRRINEEIVKAVDGLEHVQLLDLSGCFLTAEGKLDTNAYLPDLVHLTQEGYERWKNAIQKYVDEIK